jgi:hypothetical protein
MLIRRLMSESKITAPATWDIYGPMQLGLWGSVIDVLECIGRQLRASTVVLEKKPQADVPGPFGLLRRCVSRRRADLCNDRIDGQLWPIM